MRLILELLIPDLQTVLFCGPMSPRLQAFMPALTKSDHVFLGLPRALKHGTSTAVTSCIPSLAHNKSMEISSLVLIDATDPSDH